MVGVGQTASGGLFPNSFYAVHSRPARPRGARPASSEMTECLIGVELAQAVAPSQAEEVFHVPASTTSLYSGLASFSGSLTCSIHSGALDTSLLFACPGHSLQSKVCMPSLSILKISKQPLQTQTDHAPPLSL
jgi:hypothetical protein